MVAKSGVENLSV